MSVPGSLSTHYSSHTFTDRTSKHTRHARLTVLMHTHTCAHDSFSRGTLGGLFNTFCTRQKCVHVKHKPGEYRVFSVLSGLDLLPAGDGIIGVCVCAQSTAEAPACTLVCIVMYGSAPPLRWRVCARMLISREPVTL
jgi:hypothetical protein